jgi:sulfopyruvate decarboxylase TPP-binding subunit
MKEIKIMKCSLCKKKEEKLFTIGEKIIHDVAIMNIEVTREEESVGFCESCCIQGIRRFKRFLKEYVR